MKEFSKKPKKKKPRNLSEPGKPHYMRSEKEPEDEKV
jgi:hypothetical protein